jgi:hypothetical protein
MLYTLKNSMSQNGRLLQHAMRTRRAVFTRVIERNNKNENQ